MGGSSKSSSATSSSQTSKANTIDGVNTGRIHQGDIAFGKESRNNSINVYEFSEDVKQAFSEMMGLLGKTIDTASDAGSAALNAIKERYDQQENPNAALTSKALPILGILSVGMVLYFFVKGAK